MLRLQSLGCHNINLVSPTHVVPQWLEGLALAAERSLHLPIVYNSGGYDSEETLSLLEGLVDIYMPDIKYTTPDEAERFIGARDYPEISARALRTMHTQVGDLRYGRDGIASAGLLVRHLVMPNNTANAERVLEFLATEISTETVVNIMGQYRPAGESGSDPDLTGRVSRRCIQGLHEYARSLGLHRFPQH